MADEEMRGGFLDRSVPGFVGLTCERLAWVGLAGLAVLTRLVALGERAMSHDESMHAYYSYLLSDSGSYRHDPTLHGPLLFHLNAIVYFILGDSDFTARVVPALSGVAIIAGLFAFRRYLGRWGALAGGGLALISPTMLFYSRYLVIDSPLVLASLAWSYGAFRYYRDRRPEWLYLVVVSMALSTTAKENSFIFGLILGTFFAALAMARRAPGAARFRGQPAADLSILMLTLVLPFLAPALHLLLGWGAAEFRPQRGLAVSLGLVSLLAVAAVALARWWFGRAAPEKDEAPRLDFKLWMKLSALYWLVQVVLFTTFFSNVAEGFPSGVVGSLSYWFAQHGVRRGGAPWFYYLVVGSLYEFLPMSLAACGAASLLRVLLIRMRFPAPQSAGEAIGAEATGAGHRTYLRDDRLLFGCFALWWSAGSWFAYSLAGERMPWLLIHIAFPTILLGSWWLGRIADIQARTRTPWSGILWLVPSAFIAASAAVAIFAGAPFGGGNLGATRITLRWLTACLVSVVLLALIRRALLRSGAVAVRRALAAGTALVLASLTVRSSGMLNFRNYDLATELLVYAHATPDIKLTIAEIESARDRAADRDLPLVCYDDETTWPFAWYFRKLEGVRFYGNAPDANIAASAVVLAGPKNFSRVGSLLGPEWIKRTRRLIWWPTEEYYDLTPTKAWRVLSDAYERRNLWQAVCYRRYPIGDLRQWPHRTEFEVYLKKEVAARIWGPGLPAEPTAGPVVEHQFVPELVPEQVDVFMGAYGGMPLKSPRGIAVAPDGTAIVSDTGNDRIVLLGRGGNTLRIIGRRCSIAQGAAGGCSDMDGRGPMQDGDGQFLEPWGVAVSAGGRIFVADTWNARIQAFDPAGRFLWKYGSAGSTGGTLGDPQMLYGPRGMAVLPGGELLVTDTGNKRILRLSENGEFRGQSGGGGTIQGTFDEPVGVAVDPGSGGVLVADSWNQRIQRLGAGPAFLQEWRVPGWTLRDAVSKPYVAVDFRDRIWATDPGASRVLLFDGRGGLTHYVQDLGRKLGRLNQPTGIAADPIDRAIWIADSGNDRILKLRITDAGQRAQE